MDPTSETSTEVEFGRFRVLPRRRELLVDGRPIQLGGRAFDVLMALIEASGAAVSKDALMERVWPGRSVDENSLQAQISALRSAFAADRDLIRTIAGRGYQFTGVVRTVPLSSHAKAVTETSAPVPVVTHRLTNLPEPVSELIGRDREFEEILKLTASHRIVSLTGAGGIGKTRLGLDVARCLLPDSVDGVWVIELAPLSDPDLVPVAVATALGLELPGGMASPLSVANALRSKQFVLLLDNCEHVVDAAARMAEALLRASPAARVIATSREPLRAEGEWIYPVPPLAVPMEGGSDSGDLLRYGAVRLFVERARAADSSFSPDGHAVAAIAGICRRLDGIPLGIELAAARAAALGIEGVAARLDDRFQFLASGRRTAMPRHQTLRATLDWSYELLTETERKVLCRLAIFVGGFTLPAASAVAAPDEIAASDVVDCVASLVTKSLLTVDAAGARIRYRLLETLRAYALEKLVQAGVFEAAARRHAGYYLNLFESAEAEAETRPTDEWLADYGPRIDNLRAALDWAFSPGGDASIGVALTAVSVSLWFQLSLLPECRRRVDRALSSLRSGSAPDPRQEMQLLAALAATLLFTANAVHEIRATWTKVLEIAQGLQDRRYRLRALGGLWAVSLNCGEFRETLTLAEAARDVARGGADPPVLLLNDRMMGTSLHYLGDQAAARTHLEHMLDHDVLLSYRSPTWGAQVNPQVSVRCTLARVLWLQGFPDQATGMAESAVVQARARDNIILLCFALTWAAYPVAALNGDLAAAGDAVAILLAISSEYGASLYHAWGRRYEAMLVVRKGDAGAGVPALRASLGALRDRGLTLSYTPALCDLAEALRLAGEAAEALAAIDEALARSERIEERWCIAELLRVKGSVLLLAGGPQAAATAEDQFQQALDWARRQGALSWELRAATSLARLWRDQDRSADAAALLRPVYDRFTEGFATADLTSAKAVLDDCH